jgi:uncharacterized Ntn-hydrolase superfamily protein
VYEIYPTGKGCLKCVNERLPDANVIRGNVMAEDEVMAEIMDDVAFNEKSGQQCFLYLF